MGTQSGCRLGRYTFFHPPVRTLAASSMTSRGLFGKFLACMCLICSAFLLIAEFVFSQQTCSRPSLSWELQPIRPARHRFRQLTRLHLCHWRLSAICFDFL